MVNIQASTGLTLQRKTLEPAGYNPEASRHPLSEDAEKSQGSRPY